MAHSGDRYPMRADRSRSDRYRPFLSQHDRRDGRPESDAGSVDRSHWADPRGTLRSPIAPPGSWRRGGKAGQRRLASNATPIWPDRLCDGDYACAARRWYSGRRHRLFQHLEQFADRTERRRTNVSTSGWFARLGLPGGIGCEMRGAAAKSHLLVRRWGAVLPPDGTGDRAARGIAVVLVVNNNSGFGQGWPNIQRQQGNKPGDVAELARFGPTNFADVARRLWTARDPRRGPLTNSAGVAGRAGVG